jgi:hypothetical protein
MYIHMHMHATYVYKSGFHLNCLTAQLSYEWRAAVEGGK